MTQWADIISNDTHKFSTSLKNSFARAWADKQESQAGIVDINHASHLYYNVVCGSSFSRSQSDFEGLPRALRFPPSAKLTPSLIQYAGPHW